MIVMKRSFAFFALLALVGAAVFAQTRENVRIYVQTVAADPAQAVFFRESFAEEIEAAGYGLAYRAAAADFILGLVVRPNTILYDDGTEEPAPPGEKQFILQIGLTRVQDNSEIVAFSFPFTYLAEMAAYNQYLFYQVMTNLPYSVPDYSSPAPVEIIREVPVEVVREVLVPTETFIIREVPREVEVVREVEVIREVEVPVEVEVVREVQVPVEVEVVREVQVPVEIEIVREVRVPVEIDVVREVEVPVEVEVVRTREVFRDILVEEPDSWRNKMLYVRASADVPIGYFMDRKSDNSIFEGKPIVMPGATIGVEFQFMNWMSAELDLIARSADMDWGLNPGGALQIKFPLKPARYLMLEPYLAAAFLLNNAPSTDTPFYLEAGGGFQFGIKSGQSGALFLDVNFLHTFNNVLNGYIDAIDQISTTGPDRSWNRFVIGVGVGYKFGFMDRSR